MVKSVVRQRVLVDIESRRARRFAAITVIAGFSWLVFLLADGRRGNHHHLVSRSEWLITLTLVVMLIARGIYLGRPVSARHSMAAMALLVSGLGLHLMSFRLLGDSLLVAGGAALVWPIGSRPDPELLPQVWKLIGKTRGDPLAPFAMHSQKSHHFSSDGTAAVAYRARLGFAVVSGDPVGRHTAFADLVVDFAAMCQSRGWRIMVLGCGENRLALWRDARILGQALTAIPFGRDVVVEVQRFDMVGRRYRNLRQAVSRTHNRGMTTELVAERELDAAVAAELAEVLYASHRGARWERGFSMILDAALEGRYPGVLLMIGRERTGRIQGFQRYLVAGGGSDVSLDVSWRRPGSPNGIDERLTVDMIEWCKGQGTQRLSLAFAAFPELFDERQRTSLEDFYYRVISLGSLLIRLEALYRYLGKFHALGRRRYVLVSLRHIPSALVVLLTLEFLPRRRRLAGNPTVQRRQTLHNT
ncbi:bifunctional lysylphosphatidylglycerol flippase/synthetase MprF [Mycolicibacterium helvum]|nr:phosphatidylglycerol lysyltransferase domain-containing protein [Mycolicibacterium helvum]